MGQADISYIFVVSLHDAFTPNHCIMLYFQVCWQAMLSCSLANFHTFTSVVRQVDGDRRILMHKVSNAACDANTDVTW